MKHLIYAGLILLAVACSSDEAIDPTAGLWVYESDDISNPEIITSFQLHSTVSGHTVSGIEMEVDGELDDESEKFTATIEHFEPGRNIGRLVLTKLENNSPVKGIAFFGCTSTNGVNWAVDSIYFFKNNDRFWYYNQELTKN